MDNNVGDAVISELYLNSLDNCTITAKGFTDESDTVGIPLCCVDIANLEKKASVTTKGDFLYLTSSYYKVQFNVVGTSKIIIKGVF